MGIAALNPSYEIRRIFFRRPRFQRHRWRCKRQSCRGQRHPRRFFLQRCRCRVITLRLKVTRLQLWPGRATLFLSSMSLFGASLSVACLVVVAFCLVNETFFFSDDTKRGNVVASSFMHDAFYVIVVAWRCLLRHFLRRRTWKKPRCRDFEGVTRRLSLVERSLLRCSPSRLPCVIPTEAWIRPRSSFPRRRESSVSRDDQAASLDPRLRGDDGMVIGSRIKHPCFVERSLLRCSPSSPVRHSREDGNPVSSVTTRQRHWIPAFAGMTAR